MTHIQNVASIVREGLLCLNLVDKRGITFESIASSKVQRRRGHTACSFGGDWELLDLHEYVPLYIAKHTPMQYVITTPAPSKGREVTVSNDELVFLAYDPTAVLLMAGVLVTDGNAAAERTKFYSGSDGLAHVDWDVLRRAKDARSAGGWKEWRWRLAAEVLVPSEVPTSAIARIVVFERGMRSDLKGELNSMILESDIEDSLQRECRRLKAELVVDKDLYEER